MKFACRAASDAQALRDHANEFSRGRRLLEGTIRDDLSSVHVRITTGIHLQGLVSFNV